MLVKLTPGGIGVGESAGSAPPAKGGASVPISSGSGATPNSGYFGEFAEFLVKQMGQ